MRSGPPRLFLYVQHLLGVGHLKRAVVLAQACRRAGIAVTVASGGLPVAGLPLDGLDWIQLPPASAADAGFRLLLDERGRPIDDAWKARRRAALLEAWIAARAQALMIELFPFGRRQMRFELLPLLEHAHALRPQPLVVCSVRDILQVGPASAERHREAAGRIEQYFDRVLVHGDADWISFDETFTEAARIADRLHYTGYVVEPIDLAALPPPSEREVLVSAGGGAVGARLLQTALEARALGCLAGHTWRLITGTGAPQETLEALQRRAAQIDPHSIAVERVRSDFVALLADCALSISQGGYNTIMETVQVGARALVVPFAQDGESEQSLRAARLAARGRIDLLPEAELDATHLAAAIERAHARPRPARGGVALDGAQRSAAQLRDWMGVPA